MKAMKLLDIDNVDKAIRSRIPETFNEYSNSDISLYVYFDTMSDETLKADLKTVPYLAQFMDAIFVLGFKDLVQIKDLTDAAKNPYSTFSADKSAITCVSDDEPKCVSTNEPEDKENQP